MKKCLWVCVGLLILLYFTGVVSAYQPFPDTGQTKCYDNEQEINCPAPGEPFYGQDAQYQPRLPRSYTKLRHGGTELPTHAAHVDDGGDWIMTRDNVTGLIWEIKTDANKDDQYDWNDAQDVFIAPMNSQQFGGYSDWRMPNIKELLSLVSSGIGSPAIDENWFPRTLPSQYWSSTTYAANAGVRWDLGFNHGGGVNNSGEFNSYYVRAVRSGSSPTPTLVDNGDGTLTDTRTALMWQKATAPGTYNWQAALDYCENLTLAGHSDWRLPNRNELQTLVDYSQFNPAIDQLLAEDTYSSNYWSSTTFANITGYAQHVHFYFGYVPYAYKSRSYYVRAVRSGHFESFGDRTHPNLITWNTSLVADFGDNGLWYHDGASWNWMTNRGHVGQMVVWDGKLVVDFGADHGMHYYDGSSWNWMTNKGDVALMLPWYDGETEKLVVDFGEDRRIYIYDGSWHWFNNNDAVADMMVWDNKLVVDFGNGRSVFHHDGTRWTWMTNKDDVAIMLPWHDGTSDKLVVDFGNGRRIYTYDGSWHWLNNKDDVNDMAIWNNKLVVDFGNNRAMFNYDGSSWYWMTNKDDVTRFVPWNDDSGEKLAVDFGGGRGMHYYNGSWNWMKNDDDVPEMLAWGERIAVDFGSGIGTYNYDGTWNWMRNWSTVD